MKLSMALSALLASGLIAVSTERAYAVVYCAEGAYVARCVTRPVAVQRRPLSVGAVVSPGFGARGVGIRAGTPMNRGGPVNRVGRR